MIVFDHVTKVYEGSDVKAVNALSLNVEAGETCVLVGSSGCGKTTTMKMVNKLISLTSGRILINGDDINNMDTIKLRLNTGYIIQDIGLFPHMTVAENISAVPNELKWSKEQQRKRVDELLDMVELDPDIYRNVRPNHLSGGQKQRVGVARALAADPPIMLMDEPFGALDPITRTKLQDEFLKIQRKLKKTIIFVTHDMDEAIKMGSKIVIMHGGSVIQAGTIYDIMMNPTSKFVLDLLGARNTMSLLGLIPAENIMSTQDSSGLFAADLPKLVKTSTLQQVLSAILGASSNTALLLDEHDKVVGSLSYEEIKHWVSLNAKN